MMETNRSKGGRPRHTFADPYVVIGKNKDGKLIKTCIFCDHQFSIKTSITRVKAHLGKVEKQDVICCTKVPFEVEEAARNSMPSSSSKRSNTNIPSSSDMQQPSPQDPPQQNNDNPTCLDVQSNSLGIGILRPEDLLQEETQQPPPQRFYASGPPPPPPPPPQNVLLDGSQQQTNINYTDWDGQYDPFDMEMPEDFESGENFQSWENFQSFYPDFSSQIESCLTHGMLALPHPTQHLGEDHNRLSDQDMLQDAARIDSAHNATIPQNFFHEGGACPNSLAHSAHLEDIPIAEFENHEGLESSQHHTQENLQGDQRISSLDHDPYPSIVPQLYRMQIDPILESMDSPKSSPGQAKHEKKRKVLDQRPTGKKLPLRTTFQGPTFKNKVDEISKSLEDDSVNRIGVYGMGGSGKTTIMKFIHNLLLEGCFMPSSQIIWVTVSPDRTISQLQHHLASLLEVKLSRDEDEVAWAASLYEEMQKMRYALILDDVWDKINLEEVGIPEPSRDNRCKLILTTRSLDVCRKMQCKPIFIDLLSKEEAWELFVKTLDVDPEKSTIQDIMKEVSKECACLPLAITTIAGSMRGILNVHEWRDALDSLKNCTHGFTNMKDQVLKILKFSYYRLSEQLQKCLLTCALYPEDTDVEDGLMLMLLTEGTIGGKESLKSIVDHAQTILNKLENACLLTRVSDSSLVIHDLIQDMCLDIMGDRFLVKCCSKSPPDLSECKEDVEKVSLIGSKFEEIPSNMMPYCPKLSTLLLSMNENLTSIPDSFFMSFPKLEFLDLSGTSIQELPSSVTSLVSLNALVLDGCPELTCLPCLTPLKALKLLSLSDSEIEEAPEGLEKLVNMTFLNLRDTDIQTVSSLDLTDLVKLQVLCLPDEVKIMMKDVKKFKNLGVLEAQFADWEEFGEYVRSVLNSGRGPSFYRIKAELTCVGASCASMLYEISKEWGEERIEAELGLPEDYEVIGQIPSPEIVQGLRIYRSRSKLHQGEIGENGGLKRLFDSRYLSAFVNLVELRVDNLDFTKDLISASSSVVAFGSSPKLPPYFQNLQTIDIRQYESLESILVSTANPTEEEEESNNRISFNRRISLDLTDLVKLQVLRLPDEVKIMMKDVKKFKNLGVLEAQFADWEEFGEYVRSVLNSGRGPSFYRIKAELTCVGASCASMLYEISKEWGEERIEAELGLPEDYEVIGQIPSPEIVQGLRIYRSRSKLHQGEIGENGGLKRLFDARYLSAFVNLVELRVDDLDFIKDLISASSSVVAFSSSPKLPPYFQNLQTIDIRQCESLESILVSTANPTEEEEESNNRISFPNLRSLTLQSLPNLRGICDGTLVCPSIEYVDVYSCPKLKRLPLQVLPCFQNLQRIVISSCKSLESILVSTANPTEEEEESNNRISFPNLRSLTLQSLPNLRGICDGTLVCPSIEYVDVYSCPKLKRLPLQVLPCFQNLQRIVISSCKSLESILVSTANPTEEEEESNNRISFPNLHGLTLQNLPNLRGICDGTLVCPSIEYVDVYSCPKLKRLPLQVPPPPAVLDYNNNNNSGQQLSSPLPPLSSLREILGQWEWWESLEWDQPHAKPLLQPFFLEERGCEVGSSS